MSHTGKELEGPLVFAEELMDAMNDLVGKNALYSFLEKNFPEKEFSVDETGGLLISADVNKERLLTLFQAFRGFLENILGKELAKNVFKNVFSQMVKKNLPAESVNMALDFMPPEAAREARTGVYVKD